MRTATAAFSMPRILLACLLSALFVLAPTGAAQATIANGSPMGNVDKAYAVTGGVRVTGWAWDPSTTAAVTVKIAIGSTVKQIQATNKRSDVAYVYPAAGHYRGFDTTVAVAAGTHKVCVTFIDVGTGSDLVFSCRSVTVGGTTSTSSTSTTSTTSSTKPSASNTGVPDGIALKRHDGDLVVKTSGAVISNMDVRGFVDIQASNVTIKNSIIRGRSVSSSRALVSVRSSSYSLTIHDTTLAPLTASPYIDGLHGQNITARRLDIYRVIDSVHLYGAGNVLLESSWLHDNAHFTSDPRWGGKPSHDDSVQIQKGSNITLRGNNVSGAYSAAIMLTQDAGAVSGLKVTNNWLDGGACVVNIKHAASAPKYVTLTDNTFGRNARYPNCGIKVPSSYPLTLARNYFTDGKTVPRTA